MVTVLCPSETAERCFLSEALRYVAVGRLPLSSITEHNVDAREDWEYSENDIEPFVPDGGVITTEECEAIGLKPNPFWENQAAWVLERKKPLRPYQESEELEYARKRKEAAERQKEWDEEFQAFLDKHRLKLLTSLAEGRLHSLGKKLSSFDDVEGYDDVDGLKGNWWEKTPWEPIPPNFWMSSKIDWDLSRAEGRGIAYILIEVVTDDLIGQFPLPAPQVVNDVVKIGQDLVLLDGAKVKPKAKSGRPAFKWEDFHVEVAKRLQKGPLPQKQESFISEMDKWCEIHWGRKVGRSTLLGKIKPYYDAFVRTANVKK